ncbi:MAG: PDZ domain-containing protein, partial [Planctomycetales bacterium]
MKPQKIPGMPIRLIGVRPAFSIKLSEGLVAELGSPAAAGMEALQTGDQIVEIDGQPIEDCHDYLAYLAKHPDKTIAVTFARNKPEGLEDDPPVDWVGRVTVTVAPRFLKRYGLIMEMGPIIAVRPGSPAAKAGIRANDRIVKIDGQPAGDPFDLPEMLRKLAGKTVSIEIQSPDSGEATKTFQLPVETVDSASSVSDTMDIPSLGIAYKVLDTVAKVKSGSPADGSGIQAGDQLVDLTLKPASAEQAEKERERFRDEKLGPHEFGGEEGFNWPIWIRGGTQGILDDTETMLTVRRGSKDVTITLPPPIASETIATDRGFRFVSETDLMRANSIGEAMAWGWRETKYSMMMVYR